MIPIFILFSLKHDAYPIDIKLARDEASSHKNSKEKITINITSLRNTTRWVNWVIIGLTGTTRISVGVNLVRCLYQN
jgi:hypothetical protein